MDHGSIVLLIPIVAIVVGGLVRIARLKASAGPGGTAVTGEMEARLGTLEQEITTLRQELTEAQERIDFTERLLTQAKESKRVSGPE